MKPTIKISIYWMLIGVCMILHTQLSFIGLFFGQNIAIPGATGKVPEYVYALMIIFSILPFIIAFMQLNISARWFRWASWIWSLILIAVNTLHLFKTLYVEKANVDQGVLLTFVLIVNIFLAISLFKFIKSKSQE